MKARRFSSRLTRIGLGLVAGLAVALSPPGASREVLPGPVVARVLAVVDGDTLVVRARIWLGQALDTKVRLAGVDAPELNGRCEAERRRAAAARSLVRELVAGGEVVLKDIQFGKYAGRVVARVETPAGRDLGQALLAAGLARPYRGGRRESWC